MEIFEKIQTLANKQGKYSAKEREYIAGLCAEHDIFLNKLCPDCYRDAIVQLYAIYKPKETKAEVAGYKLKEGVDVIYNSKNGNVYHICEAAMTEEAAREWVAAGAIAMFEHIPEQ